MEKAFIALAAILGIAMGAAPFFSFLPIQGRVSIEWADEASDVVHGMLDDTVAVFR